MTEILELTQRERQLVRRAQKSFAKGEKYVVPFACEVQAMFDLQDKGVLEHFFDGRRDDLVFYLTEKGLDL